MTAAQAIAAVDKLTRLVQDLEDRIDRSIRLQESDATSFDMELPGLAGRASSYPYFGTDGALTLTNSVASDNTVVSTFMETVVDDATGLAALTTLGGIHIFNVKTYGATGDGVTDDRDDINTAMIAAVNGICFFPPGTYKISSALTIGSTVTAVFARGASLSVDTGVTVTINGEVAAGNYSIFTRAGTGTVVFRDFTKINVVWYSTSGDGSNSSRCGIQQVVMEVIVLVGRGVCRKLLTTTIQIIHTICLPVIMKIQVRLLLQQTG
jgi:hypothetical protein